MGDMATAPALLLAREIGDLDADTRVLPIREPALATVLCMMTMIVLVGFVVCQKVEAV